MKSPINPMIVSIMDWVPFVFIDDVCHQLRKPVLNQVSQLSADWSTFGTEHRKKRREFTFSCTVDGKDSSYSIKNRTELVVVDLNSEFDRITLVRCDSPSELRNRIKLEKLERDVLPTVASLAANCYLQPIVSGPSSQFYFNAFKNCPGFNDICVQEQGPESRDFVARQVEFGNVQRLNLHGQKSNNSEPEPEKIGEMLKAFVSSARFHQLYLNYDRPLPTDIELFELFLHRALASELKPGACISLRHITYANSQTIGSLHPDCRDYSKKDEWIAWRILNSNLRILLRKKYETLWMGVQ